MLGLPRACTRLGSSCTQVALGTWPLKVVRNLMASALSTAAPVSSSPAARCSSGTMCCSQGAISQPRQPGRAGRGRKGCIAAGRWHMLAPHVVCHARVAAGSPGVVLLGR